MIKLIDNEAEKQKITKDILNNLPEWFGIEESTKEYINNVFNMPFFIAKDENIIKGFLALKETSKYTCEIYVMGILKQYHRNGLGKLLANSALDYAKTKGYEFMQVKTVKEGIYPIYDISNKFYKSLGFKELECIDSLWDKHNPCQIYIRNI